jgi:hypothetical protein
MGRTHEMIVFGLVLGTPPVLNIVAFAFLVLHDLVDAARRTVLAVVVEATSELPLLAFTVMLLDVVASVGTTRFLSRLARRSTPGTAFPRGWLTSSWIVRSMLCVGRLDQLRECQLDVDAADLDVALFSSTRAVVTRK